tara:strand:+ start:4706 stop:4936 length:231 start_codon:yes stop_codon:yes gene_type:complete
MNGKQKKYAQRMQDHEGTKRVFDKEIDHEKFGEDIQEILDKHQFAGETRRQIFSRIMEAALASKKEEAGGSQNDQR